jgi:hypothetical protein
VHLLPGWRRPPKSPPPDVGVTPLTRKACYDLAAESREVAETLARFDQHRIVLAQCHDFNDWLAEIKQYDLLAPHVGDMAPARPVARWQILALGFVFILFLFLLLPPKVGPIPGSFFIYACFFTLIAFFFVPQSLYGTTIELLEAKTLRIVEALEEILQEEKLGFSEAAYFRTKENLTAAKRELRQQIDLAHRRWR